MQTSGQTVDLRAVTQGFGEKAEVPHAAALAEFAEAVVLRDTARSEAVRTGLRKALGLDGLVDAAATVAAFHGFVRLADAIGIPYTTAARGNDAPEVREQAGINAFYRVQAAD
jgi:alcohol dehydrogenase class IV